MYTQELTHIESHASTPATRELSAAPVVDVAHLHKAYGTTVAVDDVSFTVGAGEIFGILGRNGAGKTTTVECITGLRTPDRGSIGVLGLDPRRDRHELHERVGVQLQHGALPDRMRVGEAVRAVRLVLPPAGGRARAAGLARARSGAQPLLREAVGGAEAAAVDRAGPDRSARKSRCSTS